MTTAVMLVVVAVAVVETVATSQQKALKRKLHWLQISLLLRLLKPMLSALHAHHALQRQY